MHFFRFFRPMEKMASDGPKYGQEDFFPTNPDLADILGRTDLNFENFFFDFLDPKFLDFQVPRSPNFWISRSPDFQTPPPPTPPPPPPTDEPSDPNLTPLPTHPGIKYVARALAAIYIFYRAWPISPSPLCGEMVCQCSNLKTQKGK